VVTGGRSGAGHQLREDRWVGSPQPRVAPYAFGQGQQGIAIDRQV
jgi:hypothetical protein